MKVKIGNFWLSEGDVESPSKFEVQEARETQTIGGLRWEKKKNFDRKNKHTAVSFSVTRVHETIADAEFFILTHGPNAPTSGTLEFQLADGRILYSEALSCSCTLVSSGHIGVTTTHNYSLICGEVQDSRPT